MTPMTPPEKIAIVQADLRREFDMHHDFAADALRNVVRTAQAELDRLDNPEYMPGTDFVSQHADKYAEAVAKMQAISRSMAAVNWLTRDDSDTN